MFEEQLPPQKNGRPRRDRAAGVLVSLLIHSLLGLAVYHGRFTIKVFPSKREEVRTVVIVPPLKVAVPKVVGGRDLAEVPGTPPGGRVRPDRRPAVEEPEAGPGEEEGGAGELATGAAPLPGAASAIPSLSSMFQRSLAIRGRSDLTIPLAPPGTPPGPPGFIGAAPIPDFTKIDRGASGIRGGYGPGIGRGGGSGGRQRVGMSIPLKGYDLLPWASSVVDRIQRYWVLPFVYELPEAARVMLIVVVKKSGDLDSIEILEGTGVEALDRSALEAVRGGLPFPALPADFPGDLLEVTFEFVYND
jgi:TonB family protein